MMIEGVLLGGNKIPFGNNKNSKTHDILRVINSTLYKIKYYWAAMFIHLLIVVNNMAIWYNNYVYVT